MFELGGDGPGAILVGVDGSETSLRAGSYAAGLARRQGARVVVLFVHTPPGAGILTAGLIEVQRQAQATVVDELRAEVEHHARLLGLSFAFYERHGNPYLELIRLADELRVDAVVIGASMRAGHRLVGSLATRLVRDAKWPVTVVP
ncbi:universal stress protein [Kribbella sp. NPDC051586]|uniref:universal stress protein n=1 Tax=Kribbella sp. NPDC051586 TaxID=3364118 RepID=UPI0037ACBCBF